MNPNEMRDSEKKKNEKDRGIDKRTQLLIVAHPLNPKLTPGNSRIPKPMDRGSIVI